MSIAIHEQRNIDLIALHKMMDKALVLGKIKATSSKEHLTSYVKPIPRLMALHENFIWYGTKRATNFLIIDIDYVDTPIDEYKREVEKTLGLNPTWILRTSKGYHIGFILDNTIFTGTKEYQALVRLKATLCSLLDADLKGSLRTYGYWRNPLTHNSIINTETFNIFELEKLLQVESLSTPATQKATTLDKAQINKDGFAEGNRNSYLFQTAVNAIMNGKATNSTLESYLLNTNAQYQNKIEDKEVIGIAKSVCRYGLKARGSNKMKDRPLRGKYSDMLYASNIHNFRRDGKEINQRARAGQAITSAKRVAKTTASIIDTLIDRLQKGKSIIAKESNREIAEAIDKDIRTLQRYRKKDLDLSSTALLEFLKSIGKDIRAIRLFRANVVSLINEAISHLEFIEQRDKKVFEFRFLDTGELIFYERQEERQLCA